MSQKQSVELCVYCGARPGLTRDHIPPAGLFPHPRPSDLVTVPCCTVCRATQTLDDEYFIRCVALRLELADHPAAQSVLPAVLRSFTKPKKRAFSEAMFRSIRYVDIQSDAGLHLGTVPTFNVDLPRVSNVIQRTTVGLLFDRTGARLPEGYRCKAYALGGLARDRHAYTLGSLAVDSPELNNLATQAGNGERRTWGSNVFSAWFQELEGPPLCTLWAFVVFERALFVALTGPATDTAGTVSGTVSGNHS